jgi:hypothetical protein
MTLPPHSRFRLADDLSICRILNGMYSSLFNIKQ